MSADDSEGGHQNAPVDRMALTKSLRTAPDFIIGAKYTRTVEMRTLTVTVCARIGNKTATV